MRAFKIVVGTVLSILIFGLGLPIAFWFVAKGVDTALHITSLPIETGISRILTGLLWSMGLFWIFWAYSYLVFVGGGSPLEAFGVALEPTKHLVTTGPYAYVRHPTVFGLLIILIGVSFLAQSISGLILVPIAGLIAAVYLILFEEKALAKRFPREYGHWRAHVPMLIPMIQPYVPEERRRRRRHHR